MDKTPDANDILREYGPEGLRGASDNARTETAEDLGPSDDEPGKSHHADDDLGVLSSAEFVAGFSPPDYLVDGIVQRGRIYSNTGQTGAGKTAVTLRLKAHVLTGMPLNGREVAKGRTLMLSGENPDDVRARWIAQCEQMGLFPDELDAYFIPRVFSIPDALPALHALANSVGGFSLVIVDTSAAYFQGDEENNNVQLGAHARDLRELTTLAGKPTVVVNCHPTKNASADNLLPRGGGAFIAEIDGNLTSARKDGMVELHWQGKFRGPEFEPIMFELITVTSDKLKDSRGRHMPTVIAKPLSYSEQATKEKLSDADIQRLLVEMLKYPCATFSELAEACGWRLKTGEPHKSKIDRNMKKLKDDKLAKKEAGKWVLTTAGEKVAKRAAE
jgi:hypothetical protein